MPTLDFSASWTSLGTSFADAMNFSMGLILSVMGSVMIAAAVYRGLRAVMRNFGLGNPKVDSFAVERLRFEDKNFSTSQIKFERALRKAKRVDRKLKGVMRKYAYLK